MEPVSVHRRTEEYPGAGLQKGGYGVCNHFFSIHGNRKADIRGTLGDGYSCFCGFTFAREFGIRYHDLPEGADSSFFLCKELIPGYLDDTTGVYQTPQGYYVKDEEVDEFDKGFPPKEKQKLPGQIF